ncbi:hypothetical protein FZD47_20965 [Bacillus infantis]|uniref:Uncharacterized protein n=1 Tax=Bacillus infantis TaxID=324767 RepID=A0A5D4SDE3_9BACI|nr:hypothetical protein [Bacillus infantis]TYS60681.1 hypothetical protein FZD47_20965 [Bacillus infantis]
MTNSTIVYKEVLDTLKQKYENDMSFKSNLELIIHFYGSKLMERAKKDSQRQYIEENIEDLIKSQFFQGYYIMRSILLDEDTSLPDKTWSYYPGIIRNEVPLLMNEIFEESPNDWYRTELGQSIGTKLIQEMENVFDLIKQIRKDVALIGSFRALIDDERYQLPPNSEASGLLLGNPFDLQFLNPQVYMQNQYVTEEQEIWDLYLWSSVKKEGGWVGTACLTKLSSEEQNFYLLQLSVSTLISERERYAILEKILEFIPSHIKAILQTRMLHVNELEILIPS